MSSRWYGCQGCWTWCSGVPLEGLCRDVFTKSKSQMLQKMPFLALSVATVQAYSGNFALRFSSAQYVRVPHESSMNAPLIDTWTIEAWVMFPKQEESDAAEAAADATEKAATLNIVGFPLRHPSLQVTRTGHVYTHVRDVGGQYFSYEGSSYLFDGQWHHLAASWDGAKDDEKDNTLSLYVDGRLERATGPGDDESGEPKHPARPTAAHPAGYVIASQCSEGLCEEGLQMGGYYQSGGGGYTGQFIDGTLDEVRIWKSPKPLSALVAKARTPLNPADEEDLLFYFPFDEVGMETGSIVVESKAYPWFGILGNSQGRGRPMRVPSTVPIKCPIGSKAQPCTPGAAAEVVGLIQPKTSYASASGAPTPGSLSSRTLSTLLLATMLVSALLASMLTRAVLLHGTPLPN